MRKYQSFHRRVKRLEPVRHIESSQYFSAQKALSMLSDEDLYALQDVLTSEDRKAAETKNVDSIERYSSVLRKVKEETYL